LPDPSKPRYQQIADDIKQQMFDGTLRGGMRLPAVRDLAAPPGEGGYGCSHATVQRAFEQLRTEGLIRSDPEGTYVTNTSRAVWAPQQGIRAPRHPRGQRIQVTDAALIHAPRYVASMLGSDMVVRRQWLTYGMDGPVAVMLSVSWTPAWALPLVPELATLWPLSNPGGAAPMIAAALGEPLTWGWISWESRTPLNDGREQPLLHLAADSPCTGTVIKWGIGEGESQQVVEYVEFVVGPGKAVEAELIP
jgi:DNA-binding transcriptional regulator YhcF (GntR family)